MDAKSRSEAMYDITLATPEHNSQERTAPRYLLVGSTPGADAVSLIRLLSNMGAQVRQQSEPSPMHIRDAGLEHAGSRAAPDEEPARQDSRPVLLPIRFGSAGDNLQQMMEPARESVLVIFYAPPEPLLTKAIAEGTSLSAALERWCAASRDILKTIRRYRRQALVFSARSALANTSAFKLACRERLGLIARPMQAPPIPTPAVPESHRLLAAQVLAQSGEACELLDELDAMAMPCEELPDPRTVDSEKVLAEWQSWKSEVHHLTEENRELRLQLHRIQQELEACYLQLASSEEKLSLNQGKLKRLEKSLAVARERHKTARHRVKHLQRELEQTQSTLTAIRGSLSWRLTKPLRSIRGALRLHNREANSA